MFRPQVLHSATDWSHDDFLRAMVPLLTESDEKSPEKLTADEAFLLSAWVVMLREEEPIRGFIDDLFLHENIDALHAVIADDQAGFVQAMLRLSPSVTLPGGQKATPADAAQVVGLMEAVEKRILSISQPDGGPGHGSSPSEPPPSGASATSPSGTTATASGGRAAGGGQGQVAAAHAQSAQGASASPARGAGGMTQVKAASAFRPVQAAASGTSAPQGSAIPAWALVAGGVGILATGVVVSRVLK